MATERDKVPRRDRLVGWVLYAGLLLVALGVGWYWVDQDNQKEDQLEAYLEEQGWTVRDVSVDTGRDLFERSELEVFLIDGHTRARELCPVLVDLGWSDHEITVYYSTSRRWDRGLGLKC